MDTQLSLEVVQCRQFDPVSGPFSMNNERKDETQSVYSVGSQKNLVPIKSRLVYFKRRNDVPNIVMIVLILLIASLLIIVLVLSILYAHSKQKKICDSDDCVRIAASLKESMDTSVDPCDDFYKYACGRWPKEHPIPDSSLTNSWFNERSQRISRKVRELLRENSTAEDEPWAVTQARILYKSCSDVSAMNALGVTTLFDLLEELSLPKLPALLTKKTGNYIEQMVNIKRILGADIFFSIDILQDPRNKSNNIMLIDVPSLGSPLPNDKELEKRLQSIRSGSKKVESDPEDYDFVDEFEEAEKIYMTEVVKQILSNDTADGCSMENSSFVEEDIEWLVDEIYEFSEILYYWYHKLNNHTISEEDISDDNYMLVDELQKITDEYVIERNSTLQPKTIWRPFFELLFEDIVKLDLAGKDKILVANLDLMKTIALIIALADEEEIETYIWWVVVDIVVPHSSSNMRTAWSTYLKVLMNTEVVESRSLHCASAVNELMGMAVSWLFVDPSFPIEKGVKVHEMLEDIRQAFASLVLKTDWMDVKTKKATLEKNRKMASEIGFPEWLFEEGMLDEYYDGIDLSETKYLDNMIQITRLMSMAELESLHDINYSNETYWSTVPTDVNAFHSFQINQITVPVGILQFPFYELGIEALNYGAIGTVLGHELTHGFDNSGRHYDSEGNLRQWWSNETISEYTKRADCFIKHYSSYYEDEVNDYIDGELTLGENIADNGGLREAVNAYERWKARHGQEPLLPGFVHLTHEQLVFLGFAHLWCESYTADSLKWMLQDTHCPGHIRLRAVLRNSKEFSDAWNCPVGSNMNPTKKCHLW
ncbi:hypothetical protein KM043_018444 [Ampulex compressa]|nr:hypothetical protein KM043_018444 [Ampulex compressa]